MRAPCIEVPRTEGETIRKKLSELGILNMTLQICRTGDTLVMPLDTIDTSVLGYRVAEGDFEEQTQRTRSYKELLEIPPDLVPLLPTSFDIIGGVAIIKLQPELMPFKSEIGRAMLDSNPSLDSAVLDSGVRGEHRLRQLEALAGSRDLETVHREFGLSYIIDPSKAYFSPRLATERRRVSGIIAEGSVVFDMFAGVGPFSIMVARHSSPERVVACDINPAAIGYLERNLALNKVEGVEAICGDAREIAPRVKADAVIMNLPHSSLKFLGDALGSIAGQGILFLYTILDDDVDPISVLPNASLTSKRVAISSVTRVHGYSPSSGLYCIDMKIGEQ